MMKGEYKGIPWRSYKTDQDIETEYDQKIQEQLGKPKSKRVPRNVAGKDVKQKRLIIYSKHGKHKGNNKEIR